MPQARPMYLVPVSLVCLALGALAISVPLVMTQPRAEVRTTVPSTPPRYPHVEQLMELATHFANTGYSYASGGWLLSEKMPEAIAGVVHLRPPTPTDCEVQWRLNCGEVDADPPRSFLKVKQHEVREYSHAFWQCLKDEWNSAADHVPELQGGIHLISRAAAVHGAALHYQDVEHAQVRKALEKVPQRLAECEFVDDGSFEQTIPANARRHVRQLSLHARTLRHTKCVGRSLTPGRALFRSSGRVREGTFRWLRRAAITACEGADPGSGTQLAGHAARSTTEQWYIGRSQLERPILPPL